MPRIRVGEELPQPATGEFVERLATELKSAREFGQPVIYEQEFAGNRISVTVIWDDWHQLSLEDRTAVILAAFTRAEENEHRKLIALASGLTVLEAEEAGMLPFFIIPARRRDDRVTLEACQQAMIDLGASTLASPTHPRLRFPTENDAERARQELIRRLPGSDQIWVIAQDFGTVNEWANR